MSDDELRDWQSHWQQPTADLAALHAGARRDDRRHRLLALGEYLGMGALLLASLAYAAFSDATHARWTMAAFWVLGVPSLLFAWWNRRGLWGSAGLDAQAYLTLSLWRCRRSLRALRVGYGLLVASTAAVLLFALGIVGGGEAVNVAMLAWLVVFVVVHLVVMLLMHRHQRRRLRELLAISRELGDDAL